MKFKNGSIIRIKTTAQESISFAGAGVDVILFDEPPTSLRLLTEAVKRLEDRGGVLLASLTPINASAETLEQIEAFCKAGHIHDHWAGPLRPEHLIPVGLTQPVRTADGRRKDQAWIDTLGDLVDEFERPIVIDGEWKGGSVERYFVGWKPTYIRSTLALESERLLVALGIDHGDRPGKQIALVAYVDESTPSDPAVHVWDEYVDPTGTAAPADDALGVLDMLARSDIAWSEIDYAHGDRVHMPGSAQQKSNLDLSSQIRHILRRRGVRMPQGLRPEIETVKRGEGRAGSLRVGSRWIYHLINRGRLFVHPRCSRLLAALERYDLSDNDYKDPIDALRYGLDPWIYGERRSAGASIVRVG